MEFCGGGRLKPRKRQREENAIGQDPGADIGAALESSCFHYAAMLLRQILSGIVLLALATALRAQLTPDEERLSEAFKQFGQLVNDRQLAKAEALLRDVLPTPRSEPKKKSGDINISLYGLSWSMLASSYIAQEDYQNAERVLSERVNVSEQIHGPDHMAVAVFLDLLAGALSKEGKYEAATPLFRRSLRIHATAGLDNAIISGAVYTGLAESLLAQGNNEDAVELLRPVTEKSRIGLNEKIFNVYAVALREAGQSNVADKLERDIETSSHYRPGVNAQQRDFLRARLSVSRGSAKEAEGIYQNWIRHWEDWGEKVSADPKEREWDRILMEPLSAYAHYLDSQGRHADAVPIRERLRGIQKKYDIKFGQ